MLLQGLPVLLLFAITIVANVSKNFITAFFVKRKIRKENQIYIFASGSCLVSAFFVILFNGFKIEFSSYSIIMGAIFGLVTSLVTIFTALSIKSGPFGLSMIIFNGSTAITALSGFFFFGEKLTVLKILGIVFMLFCIFMANDKKEENKKASIKWIVFCIITMIMLAVIGLMQKIHQNSEHKSELTCFLSVSFLVSSITSLIIYFVLKKRFDKEINNVDDSQDINNQRKKTMDFIKLLILFIFVYGICSAFNYVINLYLAGKVESAIFFPIVNGVPLMCILLLSFLFFKEKLSKKQIIGLASGIVAIVCFAI